MFSFVAFESILTKIFILKFEFPKQFHEKCNKFEFFFVSIFFLNGLMVKALICFHESWVQTLINACINVFCINVVYKNVHHQYYML
jgi:hypothetical protein